MTNDIIRTQARYLRPGDVVGSGEIIIKTWCGVRTPPGKITVELKKKDVKYFRTVNWGKYTIIGVRRNAAE